MTLCSFIIVLKGPLLICLGDCIICFVGYSKIVFFEELFDAAGLSPADQFSQFLHWVLLLVLFTELMISGEHWLFAIYSQFFDILFLWEVTLIHIDDIPNSCIVLHASWFA
jgi:hypothetical protein